MADWYVSSAANLALPQFQISHAYVVGDIVRRITPTANANYAFRVSSITTGTSGGLEPTWPGLGGTVVSGGVTFTNVSGQSAYFWGGAIGDLAVFVATSVVTGDRVFISSDHSETQTATVSYGAPVIASFGIIQYIVVNRAGSTPPVAADVTTGAVVGTTGVIQLDSGCEVFATGLTYSQNGANNININSSGFKAIYVKNGQLFLNTATTTVRITANNPATLILDNSTLKFGNAAQFVTCGSYRFEINWSNTPNAIAGATIPSVLFQGGAGIGCLLVTARAVDLSAITGTLVKNANGGSKYLFESCKIAAAVTRYDRTSVANSSDVVEFVNCYDGTNIINERYAPAGTLTTERTIVLTGGATDDVGTFSHKLVTTANIDKFVQPFESFWLDVEQSAVGSAKTATVEIVGSASLNNDEIALFLEYEGTSSSSVASFADSFVATPLTAAAAVTTSTATWTSSPSTPVYQKLQVTFTPRTAGRLRGIVRVGKASTTVYIDPRITVT